MTTQPEALRLADLLVEYLGADHPAVRAISAELRRLHADNERLEKLCHDFIEELTVLRYDLLGELTALRVEKQMRAAIAKAEDKP